MPRSSKRPAREPFSGWWKAPAIAVIPCTVLFLEVWMNVHIIDNAYQRSRMTREIDEAREGIHELKKELAELETVQKMADAAPDLGLVEAEYGQFQTVHASNGAKENDAEAPIAIAASERPTMDSE